MKLMLFDYGTTFSNWIRGYSLALITTLSLLVWILKCFKKKKTVLIIAKLEPRNQIELEPLISRNRSYIIKQIFT